MTDIPIKALFLDLDGTLLNDRKQITPKNRAAINAALSAGHQIVIATGRPAASALIQAKALGLDQKGCYCISYNGASIYHPWKQEVIFERTLPLGPVCSVFHEARKRGLHIQTYRGSKVIVDAGHIPEALESYCKAVLMEYETIDRIEDLKEEPVKMLAIDLLLRDKLEKFRIWINTTYPDEIESYFSNPYYLEIVPKHVNKRAALLKLASLLNIKREDTIAAGDAPNDMEMLKAAGIGAAIGNGYDEVKSCADYITKRDNNHDAIAEIIETFMHVSF